MLVRMAFASDETGVFPSVVSWRKRTLPDAAFDAGCGIRVGNNNGDGVRDFCGVGAAAIDVVRARQPGRAERRSEAVSKLREIGIGDEGVAKRLLLLFGEGQQSGLADGARLNSASDGIVRSQSGLAGVGFGQSGDRSEALQHRHVRWRLRVCRGEHERESNGTTRYREYDSGHSESSSATEHTRTHSTML